MATPRSFGRKLLLAAGVVAGVLVLLVVVLLLVVNSGVATKRAVDLVLPSVSKALGREVTLKDAGLKLFPNPRVTLAGLTVAGRPGEPALVEAEALDVEVGLWPLLTSLGRRIEVRSFTLVRPSVNLVKAKDGTWNYEGLGAQPGAEAKPAPPAQPSPPSGEPGASVAVSLVKIEGAAIKLIDRSQGRQDVGVALTQLDLEARGVGPGLPLEARLAAALADARQNLHAQLSVARLPSGVPQGPADWPQVQGSLQLSALALDRFHALLPGDVGAIVRGGSASLDAKLSTLDGAYRVDGAGALKDVRLRGQPSAGSFRALATWSPAKPDAAKLEISGLKLQGPGIDLGGSVSVETAPMRAWFVITGPLLDLDAVMGILPEAPASQAQGQPQAQAQPVAAPGGDLVPEATRRQIQAAAVHGTIALERLKGGRLEATDVKARATLSKGALVLDEMTAAVFGGRVSAAGTRVSLAEKVPTWKLAAKLSGLDLEKTISAFAQRAPLLGKLDGTLEIDGQGTDWEKMRDALTGLAALAVKDGALTTTDVGASILGGVSQGLAAIGKGAAAKKIGGSGGKTTFRDLAGQFTVKDGFLTAKAPLAFASSAGDATLGGRIGLDGRLGLDGKVIVPRKTLAEAVSGVPLPEKLEVPLGLGGTLSSPSVSVRGDEAAASLVKGSAKQAVEGAKEKVQEKVQERGKSAVEGLLKRFGK